MNTTPPHVMRRIGVVVLALAAALLLALVVPRGQAAQQVQLAKKCSKGFVTSKGKCVCPKARVKKGGKCVARTTPGTTTGGGTTGGGGQGGGATGGGAAADPNGPPFSPPAAALSGNDAWNKIKPYFLNATFTDCVAGWPACAGGQEQRYGFFGNLTMAYCRLTSSSGSDIINAPAPMTITGADQSPTGEWHVSYALSQYGNTTYYWWDVLPSGAVAGRYWGPGLDPTVNAPSQDIGGLTWVRGARDCSY